MKITGLPEGTVAVKWNNARRKVKDICLDCLISGDKIFTVGSDEFKMLEPPPRHDDCECYLTFIDDSGREIRDEYKK